MPGVAVVTVAHGRHHHLRRQHHSLARGRARPDLYVVVAMDDPHVPRLMTEGARETGLAAHVLPVDTDPDGLPLAAARNWGMDLARCLGHEVLIGLDVDCLAGPGLVAGYSTVVADRPACVWSGPVTYLDPAPPGGYPLDDLASLDAPHPARPSPAPGELMTGGDPRLFWSLSYALSAPAWIAAGGFDEAYVGYGGEDTDFGRRVVDAGLDLGWVGAARAYHQHHPTSDPPVQHVDDILRNGRLFRDRWGEWPMQGWLDQFEQRGLVRREGDDYVRTSLTAARR